MRGRWRGGSSRPGRRSRRRHRDRLQDSATASRTTTASSLLDPRAALRQRFCDEPPRASREEPPRHRPRSMPRIGAMQQVVSKFASSPPPRGSDERARREDFEGDDAPAAGPRALRGEARDAHLLRRELRAHLRGGRRGHAADRRFPGHGDPGPRHDARGHARARPSTTCAAWRAAARRRSSSPTCRSAPSRSRRSRRSATPRA